MCGDEDEEDQVMMKAAKVTCDILDKYRTNGNIFYTFCFILNEDFLTDQLYI
jgi:hypothetical protein